jgi:cell wall-associated NlpC family hydrolase
MNETTYHLSRPKSLLITLLSLSFFFGSSFADIKSASASSEEVMMLREHITGYAQNFIGLKYRYAGSSPNTGFDCSGFTSYILKEFDVRVSSCSHTQSKQGLKVDLEDVVPGDLLFFGRKGGIQHVAMVVERTEEGIFCVHSTSSRGIVVENINTSKYWSSRLLFARDVISTQVSITD